MLESIFPDPQPVVIMYNLDLEVSLRFDKRRLLIGGIVFQRSGLQIYFLRKFLVHFEPSSGNW